MDNLILRDIVTTSSVFLSEGAIEWEGSATAVFSRVIHNQATVSYPKPNGSSDIELVKTPQFQMLVNRPFLLILEESTSKIATFMGIIEAPYTY